MWTYQQNPQPEDVIHFGIKGMKWGIRRSLAQLGRALKGKPGTGSKATSSTPAKPKPKSLSEMSDEELRAKLNRFDMEKRYKQYLAEMNPKKESLVKKVAMRVLENGLTTLGNKAFERIGQNILKKAEEPETPLSDLAKRELSKLTTKDMQRLNTHYAARTLLEKTRTTIEEEKRRRAAYDSGGGI